MNMNTATVLATFVFTLVTFGAGVVVGCWTGVKSAMDEGLAAADRLKMGDQWIREMALRRGLPMPPGWKRPQKRE